MKRVVHKRKKLWYNIVTSEGEIDIKYLSYVWETIKFNHFYRWFHGSDISLFDNCSWKSFKRYTYKKED